jgi:hypothetical protein
MEPTNFLTIIHDKMDHSKTASPHFFYKNKVVNSSMELPVAVMGMIAHGHEIVWYADYGLDVYLSDSNHFFGSLVKLLRDLESSPKYSSHKLFVGGGTSPLFQALFHGVDVCEWSLLPPKSPILATPLPLVWISNLIMPTLIIRTNLSLAFVPSLFIGLSCEAYINFLNVGHTHNNIDLLFGRCSWKLIMNDYLTLPLLIKLFMDIENQPVILHLVEEIPNFKAFVDGYLCSGNDALQSHTNEVLLRW